MFNNHHLPKSIINEAANLLGSTNNDFELTPELSEIVVEAACDYVQCATLEDRKAIIEWHIEQVANINDLEPQMIANFERAVEYTVREGKAMDAMRGGMEAAKRAGKRVVRAVKGAAGTLGSAITGETDPKAGVYTGVAGQQLTRKLAKRLPMQTNSVDYSQLMGALAELNEQQFEAYVDNLSESEFAALEQIVSEAQFKFVGRRDENPRARKARLMQHELFDRPGDPKKDYPATRFDRVKAIKQAGVNPRPPKN